MKPLCVPTWTTSYPLYWGFWLFSEWWGREGTPRYVGYRIRQQGGHRWEQCSLIVYWFIIHSFLHSFIISVRYFSNIRDMRKNKLVSSVSVTYSQDLSVYAKICKSFWGWLALVLWVRAMPTFRMRVRVICRKYGLPEAIRSLSSDSEPRHRSN